MGVDEDGNKIPHGRSFSSDILRDKSIQKYLSITTQTIAKFTPKEYQQFVAKHPGKEAIFDGLKEEKGGMIEIDVTKVTEAQKDELGYVAFHDLNRLTYNIPYKFKVARIGMNAQSVAHVMIIVFIILGNIGYFMQKARQARQQ
jgi:hypothetical protein